MDIVINILSFIVAISILVAVHEFGHFWVARKVGVKVLRFSIGFGKPLWKKVGRDGTEYVIAALPLGGYVKMLGETSDMPIKEEEKKFAHENQSVYKRFAIAFAGPAFNLIFAVIAYFFMFSIGVTGSKPILDGVVAESPAYQAGLQKGDQIIEVNGNQSPIWSVVFQSMIPSFLDNKDIALSVRDQRGEIRNVTLVMSESMDNQEPADMVKSLGFKPWMPNIKPIVGVVVEDLPAFHAGLKTNDKIVSLDSMKVSNWSDLVDYVSVRPGKDIQVKINREGQIHTLDLHTNIVQENGKAVGKMGIGPKEIEPIPEDKKAIYQYAFIDAIAMGLEKTWENTLFTFKMIGKIITGQLSIKNLSGPVNIAIYAGYSASAGLANFFHFLAIVSISLAVLNLLPIPVLDGGHLMYYLIEMVKGSPVSDTAMEYGQRIGILILFLLMSVAFYNDIARLFG